ncbi:MAG: FAD-dependent oxidoreductase [Aureliella sp.]
MRAIIIGSGIAGLSAAHALRRCGIEVTVYERAPALGEVGAGIGLWANALRALKSIGLDARVRAAAMPMAVSEIRLAEGHRRVSSLSAARLNAYMGYEPALSLIHRVELVDALAESLPPETTRFGFECEHVQLSPEAAEVRFKNGHVDRADLLVGADGIHSVVRAQLFGTQPPRYAGYTCWRGVCARPTSIAPGYVGEWWGRGQRLGITSLTEDRVYWFATRNAPPGERSDDERAAAAAAFRHFAEPAVEMIESTPQSAVLRNDIIDRPPDQRRWTKGRAVLIGDAAHPTTPNLGQGGCMAIEDAVVLAQCLQMQRPAIARAAQASERSTQQRDLQWQLDNFVARRFPRTRTIVDSSWKLGKIGQYEGRLACWLRDLAVASTMPLLGARSLPRFAAYDVGPID